MIERFEIKLAFLKLKKKESIGVDMSTSSIQSDFNLSDHSSRQLLALLASVSDLLRSPGVTQSSNSPVGDLAEFLFRRAFGWEPQAKSNAYVDAVGKDGSRYQIKGRRLTSHKGSRQLSAIRDLKGHHFDYLAGVIFSENFLVQRAAIIPCDVVESKAEFQAHTNSHIFLLRDDIWEVDGVRDVTDQLRSIDIG